MRIAMVTPTYAADIERFSTLRASLDAVNCTWPHYVVVQTEDLGLFRQLALSPAVTLLSSADVLPATVETARRRLSGYSHRRRVLRRSLNKRFGWFADATCDGWHAQQLIKLMLASKLDRNAVPNSSNPNRCLSQQGSKHDPERPSRSGCEVQL